MASGRLLPEQDNTRFQRARQPFVLVQYIGDTLCLGFARTGKLSEVLNVTK